MTQEPRIGKTAAEFQLLDAAGIAAETKLRFEQSKRPYDTIVALEERIRELSKANCDLRNENTLLRMQIEDLKEHEDSIIRIYSENKR